MADISLDKIRTTPPFPINSGKFWYYHWLVLSCTIFVIQKWYELQWQDFTTTFIRISIVLLLGSSDFHKKKNSNARRAQIDVYNYFLHRLTFKIQKTAASRKMKHAPPCRKRYRLIKVTWRMTWKKQPGGKVATAPPPSSFFFLFCLFNEYLKNESSKKNSEI
jgi:hypothetical protein